MAPDASDALAARQKVHQLLTAAKTGNIDLLKKLASQLDDGVGIAKTVADINDGNKRGALHFASREGQYDVCKYLVEELGLPVDSKDEEGETPFLHAAWNGHTECAVYLLNNGANPSATNEFGASALHHSASMGNVDLLTELLSRGLPVDSESNTGSPLIYAAGHGQVNATKLLLQHSANPNFETEDGATPLVSAVAAGSLECSKLLIQAGSEINFVGGGATPLLVATESGNIEIIKCLLKAGANVNLTAGGTTALHISAFNGNLDVVKCLLEAGADPNLLDEDSHKPIEVARERGHGSVVEILFPLTLKIDSYPVWTVEEILRKTDSKSKKDLGISKEAPREKPEVSHEAKLKAADAKSRGDSAFKSNDFEMAIQAYTQAIDLDPSDGTLYSNRSLCWLRMGQAEHALSDAQSCRQLRPDWPKGCYREGAALRLMEKYHEAANSFYEGVKLDPLNKELVAAFRESVDSGKKFHQTQQK